MKRIRAAEFKNRCLKILDEVAASRQPVVVTKRGRAVVQVIPYVEPQKEAGHLAGSILRESEDPYSTGESWDADVS
ncbi:MAG TPA: type II toxin-antitoxin system Phd/YefM family antitoxin [Acidobacteriota bacterium]|nr:type II toxin-antitoxin system Phd/YefM family antitoxin [Acidobacteriota bacterium]